MKYSEKIVIAIIIGLFLIMFLRMNKNGTFTAGNESSSFVPFYLTYNLPVAFTGPAVMPNNAVGMQNVASNDNGCGCNSFINANPVQL